MELMTFPLGHSEWFMFVWRVSCCKTFILNAINKHAFCIVFWFITSYWCIFSFMTTFSKKRDKSTFLRFLLMTVSRLLSLVIFYICTCTHHAHLITFNCWLLLAELTHIYFLLSTFRIVGILPLVTFLWGFPYM